MKTFELEDFLFHFVNQTGISIMCMTDKKFGQGNNKKLSFAFLRDVQAALNELYTIRDLQNAQENSLSTFSDTIREKIVSKSILIDTFEFRNFGIQIQWVTPTRLTN